MEGKIIVSAPGKTTTYNDELAMITHELIRIRGRIKEIPILNEVGDVVHKNYHNKFSIRDLLDTCINMIEDMEE